jgi:GAF domain-containing protein
VTSTEHDLAERLVRTAQLLDSSSVHETLQRIVDLAVATVPGCDHAGISMVHGRRIATPAASDSVALRLDATQMESGQGPCLDAIADDQIFRCDDLAAETRWPAFSARASAETGVVSMLAIRLFARGRILGALNLMSSRRAAFDDDALAVAALFASLAAVALSSAQAEEGLKLALRSRDVIGQAKGILMERHGITDQEAFDRLSWASQHLNVRLSEVAERVVFTGESPDEGPGPKP